MKRLNLFGEELMNYKRELMKESYPKVVKDSLHLAIDKFLADDFITSEIHESFSPKVSVQKFEDLLLKFPKCVKTKAEMEREANELKDQFIQCVYEDPSLKPLDVDFEVHMNEEVIEGKRTFLITEDFLKGYFYIPTEEDLEVLMKRKGFIEKFAILRLEKIFNDFLGKIEETDRIKVAHTNVFFDSDLKCYGILLTMDVTFDDAEQEEIRKQIGEQMAKIFQQAEEHYNIKMYG